MKGDIYHILNRGVEKRKIFFNKKDYFRFIYGLYDFNTEKTTNFSYWNRRKYSDYSAIGKPNEDGGLVDVLCWCLMPNHYHILVKEKTDNGSSNFSKKLSSSYTQYFNLKNERSGILFQGKSKIIQVKQDEHFMYLPYYILSNPVKLIEKNWKETGIKNSKRVFDFLESYKWSSYLDIIGERNFPFIINQELFLDLFGINKNKFKNWLFGYRKAE